MSEKAGAQTWFGFLFAEACAENYKIPTAVEGSNMSSISHNLELLWLKKMEMICNFFGLLQEMLKYSKGCDGTDDLQEALTSILGILKAVNDSMHLIAITGYEVGRTIDDLDERRVTYWSKCI